jgi:hypothetical protein
MRNHQLVNPYPQKTLFFFPRSLCRSRLPAHLEHLWSGIQRLLVTEFCRGPGCLLKSTGLKQSWARICISYPAGSTLLPIDQEGLVHPALNSYGFGLDCTLQLYVVISESRRTACSLSTTPTWEAWLRPHLHQQVCTLQSSPKMRISPRTAAAVAHSSMCL